MKKKLLILPIMLLFSTLIVSFGSSIWIFDANKQVEVEPKIKVDDIEENYIITTNTQLQEDYYTVRFYCQSGVETSSDNDGYWSNFSNSGNGKNQRHGYKEINVYKSLSYNDLLDIGRPLTTLIDSKDTIFTFAAWSVNKSVAQTAYNNGRKGWQGDFKTIDITKSLAYYDSFNLDGTNIGDKIINLYAIYSIGKDYSKNGVYHAIKMENSSNGDTRWFGFEENYRVGNSNFTRYYYRNFFVTEEQTYTIKVDAALSPTIGWINRWDGDWSIQNSFNFSKGYYNIYAFFTVDTINNDLETAYNNKVLGTNYLVAYAKLEHKYNISNYRRTVYAYFVVEEAYEFKITGGPAGTFNFDDENTEIFYVEEFNKKYLIEHVYFGDIDNFFSYEYNSKTGHYKNSCFTIGHLLTTSFNNSNYRLIIDESSTEYIEHVKGKSEINQDDYDYYFEDLSTQPLLDNSLLKVTKNGYYNFEITINYNQDLNGTIHYDNIDSILVKATMSNVSKFLKIYDLRNENFEVIPKNSNGFVDHTNDIYNSYLKYESVNLTTNINIKDVILVDKQTNQNITMQELLILLDNNNLTLYDHVTETEINQNLYDSNYIFTKNYIFYIKNKSN